MGEFATRISDGQEVKIGTCESMYYLRFEDRFKVRALSNNVDPVKDAGELKFRVPFPDEDQIEPGGEYKDYRRGYRLYRQVSEQYGNRIEKHCEDFSDPSLCEDPGTMQLHNDSGLLLNVKCYHGEKLPAASDDVKPFWNGKSWFLELNQLRPVAQADGSLAVFPVVHCRFCDKAWRYTWADLWPYIDPVMQAPLRVYAEAEIQRHDLEPEARTI